LLDRLNTSSTRKTVGDIFNEQMQRLSDEGRCKYMLSLILVLFIEVFGDFQFDTLYIGCEKFSYHNAFCLLMSGVL